MRITSYGDISTRDKKMKDTIKRYQTVSKMVKRLKSKGLAHEHLSKLEEELKEELKEIRRGYY